jgi:hypothetical protein
VVRRQREQAPALLVRPRAQPEHREVPRGSRRAGSVRRCASSRTDHTSAVVGSRADRRAGGGVLV